MRVEVRVARREDIARVLEMVERACWRLPKT